MTNYYISVSDIATLVDNNPYQDSDECLKKYRNQFFNKKITTKQDQIKDIVSKNLKNKGVSINQFLDRVDSKNSNDIYQELTEVLVPVTLAPPKKEPTNDSTTDNTTTENPPADTDLNSSLDDFATPTSKALEPPIIPKSMENDVKKYIRSEVYKQHGKKYENTVFKWIQSQLPGVLSESQKGKGIFVGEVNGRLWRIYGKIDGMYTDPNGKKIVVEIKNRQNRLFNTIPFYEQIQVQIYMLIFEVKEAIFVQHYQGEHEMVYLKYNNDLVKRTLKDLKEALGRMDSL